MSTEHHVVNYATTTTTEIPHAKCGKCEDWTTVVVMNTVFPCPVCRPDEFQAWHAANGRIPGTAQATA